jgi:HlyD family secretion protein
LQRPAPRKSSGGVKALAIVAVLALGGAAVLVGVPGLGQTLAGFFKPAKIDVISYEVRAANLPVTVVERGSLESSKNEDVFCQVEGQTTIISILSEGKRVKKGELVCELDSAALKDALTNQEIATKGAEAAYQNAKLTREVAEIAVIEYVEGIFKQDMNTALGEIALAESERDRAVDRLAWSNRMLQKGYVSLAQNVADKVALQQKNFAFEQAQMKKKVLEDYSKEKTIKELKSEVEKARSDELAKEATWDLEKSKEAKLRRQIVNCKLFAPNDGLVVYANDPNRFGGTNAPQIEEGAAVRERQKIFSLPDINHMRVNTKVHESMIDRLASGLRARVRVDAFADQVLTGSVESVAPLPDPSSMFSSDIKVYTTLISIDKGLTGLRPGMTAQVEILVTELPDVLSVPVQAILEYKNKDHVALMAADGSYKWRDIELGISNDKLVEVKTGLKSGDKVALNPVSLMTENEKREAFGSSKGQSKKDWGGPVAGKVGIAPTPPGKSDGEGGAAGADKAKAKGKGKAKGKRGGGFAGMDPALREKLKNATPEERQQLIEQFKAANPGFVPGGGRGGGGGPPGGGGGPPGGGGGPGA